MSDTRAGHSRDQRSISKRLFIPLALLGIAMLWNVATADCPYNGHLVLGALESVINATVDLYACQTITLDAGFVIGPTGDASLAAGGAIRFRPGVRVQAGGILQARAGVDAPPPALNATTISGDVCTQYGMCGLEFTLAEGVKADEVMLSVVWGDNAASDQMTLQQCLNTGICTSLGDGHYRVWHRYQAGNFSGELRWETPTRLQGLVPFSVAVDQIQNLALQAQAGDRSVTLDWAALPADQYNLCRSETSVSHIDNCYVEGGRPIDLNIGMPPHLALGLTNALDYHFRLEGRFGDRRMLSNEATATPQEGGAGSPGTRPLNDTGIEWCADGSNNNLACPVAGYPGQDGDFGRDAAARAGTLQKVGTGAAGFDYTKIANDGSELRASATLGSGPSDWTCTRDNVTGLIWEVKTTDGGLRDRNNTYTWYQPDGPNRGNPGTQDGGNCVGSACDTDCFVQAVNAQGLCGAADWRLPTLGELGSIVHPGRTSPAVDSDFLPNTPWSVFFWSASPFAGNSGDAWRIDFSNGYDHWLSKSNAYHVRLVRGGK